MAGTVNIVINYVDGAGNQQGSPPTVNVATPNGSKTVVTLVAGDNTITVPQLPVPTFCLIIPNLANAVTMKYKKTGAETGNFISPTLPMMISFDPANLPASFVINATALFTTPTTFIFI